MLKILFYNICPAWQIGHIEYYGNLDKYDPFKTMMTGLYGRHLKIYAVLKLLRSCSKSHYNTVAKRKNTTILSNVFHY